MPVPLNDFTLARKSVWLCLPGFSREKPMKRFLWMFWLPGVSTWAMKR